MRLRLTFALWVASAATLVAAEPPPAAGDSISAAKRDFDSLKAAREKALLPGGETPRIAVPELHLNPSAPGTSQRRKEELEREAKMKKKSANWLLEAMEKDSDTRTKEPSQRTAEKSDDFERLQLAQQNGAGDKAVGATVETTNATKETKTEPPPNPLNPFLADWMSPRDYALLKPGLQSSGATAAALPGMENTGSTALVAVDLPGARSDMAGALLGPERTPVIAAARPTENPYLQIVNEPAPFVGITPPTLPPVPSTAAPFPVPTIFSPAPPPPSPVPVTKIPDFVKPADDKYFKPLKRF